MTPTSPRARAVTPLEDRRVLVTFTDGTEAEVDLTPLLAGPAFERIREDQHTFAQIEVAELGGCLQWPNGVDIDPELLYEHAMQSRSATG